MTPMEKEINKLKEYIQNVIDFTLPSFKELPGIDLYMEQVLTYINQSLESVSPDGEKMLTSFMVNNYVKAKMVAEPQKKKYSKALRQRLHWWNIRREWLPKIW